MNIRNYTILLFSLCICVSNSYAQKWTTHFAYNNVTQIAPSANEVYAISDGNLFSVNKSSEQIKKYDRLSGLHSSGITCIHYDNTGKQLVIGYSNGKIDILSASGVRYISELYNKDMTQRKNIYNVTIHGRVAYISTHYGIQTMDLRENKLVDSYWLRPNGEETPIKDVLIQGDSIYAFLYKEQDKNGKDSLYCASLSDNLSDYIVWKREAGSRISPDSNKGKVYAENNVTWIAGGNQGILRQTSQGENVHTIAYKPEGPLVNVPYRLRSHAGRLGMVQGGYNNVFLNRPGMVMLFEKGSWKNYNTSYMNSHLGLDKSTDYCDIIFDPTDSKHFFVASFGYGLMEFRQDTFYFHHNLSTSALESIIPPSVYPYVWVDGLSFDSEGNLWMLNVCAAGIKVLKQDGTWISISNDACRNLARTQKMLISKRNPNIKFVSSLQNGIGVFDDNGTIDDFSDDKAVLCEEFALGSSYNLDKIRDVHQIANGTLLIATTKGLYGVDSPEDMLYGYRQCRPVQLDMPEENRFNIFGEDEEILSIVEDDQLHVWIGTKYSGLYCLSADLSSVLYHYSIDNSPMPNNSILSLSWMNDTKQLFIGTADGLVALDASVLPTEDQNWVGGEEDLDMGHMQQWHLHYCYRSPSEIAVTSNRVYANANGALFSIDLGTEEIEYWTKSNGLNGSIVHHIAYDEHTKQLVVGYEDGRIDLLADDGSIRQLPDITLKASSIPVTINSISVGSQYVYLSMPFGIIALNTRKAETAATYYIGDEASAVDVLQIVEQGDSLYAFTSDIVYSASIKDDLANFAYWHKKYLPTGHLQQAIQHNNHIYTLQHDSLYRWEQNKIGRAHV